MTAVGSVHRGPGMMHRHPTRRTSTRVLTRPTAGASGPTIVPIAPRIRRCLVGTQPCAPERSRPRRGDPPSPEDGKANARREALSPFSFPSSSAKKVRRSLGASRPQAPRQSRPRKGDTPSPVDEKANGQVRSSSLISPSSTSAKKVRRSLGASHPQAQGISTKEGQTIISPADSPPSSKGIHSKARGCGARRYPGTPKKHPPTPTGFCTCEPLRHSRFPPRPPPTTSDPAARLLRTPPPKTRPPHPHQNPEPPTPHPERIPERSQESSPP